MGHPQEFDHEAAWRTWVCPSEVRLWRWCSWLDHRDTGSVRYIAKPVVRGAGSVVLLGFFLASGSSVQWRSSVEVAWLLGSQGAWWHQVHRDADNINHRSYVPVSLSSLWQMALKGLPWLVLLCYLVHQALKEPPWLRSFCIAQHIRHLNGHPGYGSSLLINCPCWHVRRG